MLPCLGLWKIMMHEDDDENESSDSDGDLVAKVEDLKMQ